jgi:hypothetical protein
MKKRGVCLICILALLALAVTAVYSQEGQNATKPAKVLRVGFEKNRQESSIGGILSRGGSEQREAFNVSPRVAPRAVFSQSAGLYRPFYNMSEHSEVRPFYEIPSFLKHKSVYNITDYPLIKAPNSIP